MKKKLKLLTTTVQKNALRLDSLSAKTQELEAELQQATVANDEKVMSRRF